MFCTGEQKAEDKNSSNHLHIFCHLGSCCSGVMLTHCLGSTSDEIPEAKSNAYFTVQKVINKGPSLS